MSIIMRSTVERFAQILVVIWSLTALESADGGSVTWYEPLPVKTVSSAGKDPTPAEVKLFEGHPASLSWNFSLTSVTLFAVNIRFNTESLALSGPGGSAAQVRDAYKDEFNFTWISQRLTLVIFNVTAAYNENKGQFSCELTTAEGAWVRKIQVKIVERPQIVDVTSDQDVCEHSEVTLSCNATGKPEPNITWTRVWENGTDSGALQSKDEYLVMANINRSSNGTYRCTAFNGVGEPVNQTVKVIVRYSASEVRVFNSSSYVLEGNAHTLSCQATGDPKPNVTWIKVSNNQTTHGNILEFTSIDRNDAGDYKCEASNRCGMEAKTETINVSFKPDNVTLERNTTENIGCNDMWVNFTCKSSEASPPVHNYLLLKNNMEVSFSKKGTWIEKVSQGDTFVYKCQAYQQIENVNSTNISISVKEPLAVEHMQNITVKEGRNVTKECKVAGTPPRTVFWKNVYTGEVRSGKLLNISNIRRNQRGEYSCYANNTCGSDTTKMFIDVQFKPDNVTLERNTTENNGCNDMWVNFTCYSSEANPLVHNYVLLRDGVEVSFSRKGTWIEKISQGDTFVYKCKAYQQVDNVMSTNNVTVTVNVPAAVEQIQNVTVEEGRNMIKKCNLAAGTSPSPFFWKKVNTSELWYGNVLNITDIRRNQRGEYSCYVNNTCGSDTTTMFIDVQYPPKITHIMNDTIVNDSDTVTLDCQADGHTSPSIRWIFVSNNSIVPETFRITGKQEEGFYRCIADNGVGNPATRDVYITVLHYRPVNTTLIINNGNSSVILNQTFSITCDAQANPPATYEIFRDDGHKVGSNSVVTTSVTEVEGKNSVTFKCKASNAYGDGSTAKITVEVYSSSIIYNISLCKIYAKNGEPNDLTCRASGHPAPRITWISEGKVQESRGFFLTIKPRTNGDRLYTCKAENGIGNPAEGDVHVVVEDKVGQRLTYRMTYLHEEFSHKLNDKEERMYKNLVEVALKVTEAFPECFTPVFELIRFSPNDDRKVVVFFRLLFKRPMGGKASINYLQLEAAKQTWGNVEINSIQYLEDVPDRKRCNTFYKDDQICERPKTVWIVFISCGGTMVVVGIIVIGYRFHKKRNCKDQRVGNCENEDQLALPSNHSTLSEGNPYAGENGGYANSGPLLAVNVVSEQELGAASVDSENTYAKVDKSKKKDKKKDKKAADEKPTEDQYAVVDKSKKKIKKNEPDATYAEVDMSKKSKKKPKPGEVLYADLSEFQEMQKMPEVSTSPKTLPPIKLPEAYAETQYADITQFLKGNPEDKRAEPPKERTTSTVSNIATGNKEESSAGNAGDGAETTNETGF